jgi:hypothetical protein
MIEKNNDLPGFIEEKPSEFAPSFPNTPFFLLTSLIGYAGFFSFVFLPDFPVHSVQLRPEGGEDANTGCHSSA